jgi:hypothetical protein
MLAYNVDPSQGQRVNALGYLSLAAAVAFPVVIALWPSPIGDGPATLGVHGMLAGLVHGYFLGTVLTGHTWTEQIDGIYSPARFQWAYKDDAVWIAATSLSEGVIATTLGQLAHVGSGDAVAVGTVSDVGTIVGLEAADSQGLDHNNHSGRISPAYGLVGAATGYASGALLVSFREYTLAQAEALRATVIVGLWAGATAVADFERGYDYTPRGQAALLGGGVVLGAVAGDLVASRSNITTGGVWWLYGGAVLGSLLGAFTHSAIHLGYREANPMWSFNAGLGAILGLATAWWLVEPERPTPDPVPRTNASVELQPYLGLNGLTGVSLSGTW